MPSACVAGGAAETGTETPAAEGAAEGAAFDGAVADEVTRAALRTEAGQASKVAAVVAAGAALLKAELETTSARGEERCASDALALASAWAPERVSLSCVLALADGAEPINSALYRSP